MALGDTYGDCATHSHRLKGRGAVVPQLHTQEPVYGQMPFVNLDENHTERLRLEKSLLFLPARDCEPASQAQ